MSEVVAMEKREASPAHLLIKMESFSLFRKSGVDKYETKEFAAGNYKWRLIIYPNGDGTGKYGDHVSVYLAIADTKSLPENWEVNAVFSICIFNQISGEYLYTLGWTRHFFSMKTEWGFPKFMQKKTLTDPSNGYMFDDSCVFGAEVFVSESKAATVTECLSLYGVSVPQKRDWKISNFSKLEDVWTSEEFTIEEFKWELEIYPNEDEDQNGRSLSVYLIYVGSNKQQQQPGERVNARFTIRIKNQHASCKHHEQTASHWFEAPNKNWGWPSFISLDSLKDDNGGFIVNDTCVVEVEVYVQAVAK
ncbi:hypothetical protein OROMI_015202 [Orobanche minor]